MRVVIVRRVVAMVLLAGFAAGAYGLGRYLAGQGLDWADKFGSVAGFFLGALAVAMPALGRLGGWLRGGLPITDIALPQARDDLAGAQREQWEREDRLRRVNDPRPLPVRWQVTAAAESAAPGVPAQTSDPADLTGEYRDVRAVFARVPSGRLVILGPVGAGKSVLVVKLVRDLLEARTPGAPVPVVLPAASWGRGDLPDWIAEQLVRSQPGLAVRVRTATGSVTTLSHALVAGGGVLPIIDGLDELPEGLRAEAITAINAYGSEHPLVLTSRTEEYLRAVEAAGRPVSRAAVVELLPLRAAEVTAYLTEATATPVGRWEPVFERLAAEPGGPLMAALMTPLMLWLARSVYADRDADPAELVAERLTTREAIEHHLLDAFIPVAYAMRDRNGRPPRWNARQATRWLAFLAAHLDRIGVPDLVWWRLDKALHRAWVATMAIRGALIFTVAYHAFAWLLTENGVLRGGTYVGYPHLRDILLAGPLGQALRPAADGITRQYLEPVRDFLHDLLNPMLSFDFGLLLAGTIVLIVYGGLSGDFGTTQQGPMALRLRPFGAARSVVIRIAIWAGVAAAALTLRQTPHRGWGEDFTAALAGEPARWLVVAAALYYAYPSPLFLRTAVDVARGVTPIGTYRLDRRADIVLSLSATAHSGIVVWLICGGRVFVVWALLSPAPLVLRLITGGRGGRVSRAFAETRWMLAAGRRMPFRALAFLADAHERGVLRQVGAGYQFRHVRLQERLAARHPSIDDRLERLERRWEEAVALHAWALDWWDGLQPEVTRLLDRLRAARGRLTRRSAP